MGTFTPQLYKVMEFEHDEGNGFRIGLDDYPIHDPAHRVELNQLIIDEYINREIGLETVPLFIHRLRLKMRQIMPYYNKLYASELIEFGPLDTFRLLTERSDTASENGSSGTTGSNGANGATTVASNSNARNVNSETPETMLSGDEDYATGAADANSWSNSSTQSAQNTTNKQDTKSANNSELNGSTKTTGTQGSLADQLQKFRATLLNIDMMILPELNELFMLVRGNGDEILPPLDLYPITFGALY